MVGLSGVEGGQLPRPVGIGVETQGQGEPILAGQALDELAADRRRRSTLGATDEESGQKRDD